MLFVLWWEQIPLVSSFSNCDDSPLHCEGMAENTPDIDRSIRSSRTLYSATLTLPSFVTRLLHRSNVEADKRARAPLGGILFFSTNDV